MRRGRILYVVAVTSAVSFAGCSADEAPAGLKTTPPGQGALIRYDMFHKPLPEIPLPNNLATWPDPSSRTGLRINASLVASTDIEYNSRAKMNEIEGWATYGSISVAFDMPDKDPDETALDLDNMVARHQRDDFDPANDAIYVVNLETGVPVPLDIGEGSFDLTIRDKREYWANDPRRTEQLLVLETYDETAAAPGTRAYSPALDTDFDGVLDRPNLYDPDACPPPPKDLNSSDSDQQERDRCIADNFLSWYERATDTLLVSPVIPLDEQTEYAVVITDRMLDSRGRPVRSPFAWVYHPMQERGIAKLKELLSRQDLVSYYGDIGATGLDHVAFAWTFTTQPVYDDMKKLRDGLYGQGPFAKLAEQFPASMRLERAVGPEELKMLADAPEMSSVPECNGKTDNLSIVRFDDIRSEMNDLLAAVGFGGGIGDEIIDSYERGIEYLAIGSFVAPFFMEGGPNGTDPGSSFRLNFKTGEGEVHSNRVPFLILVPKANEVHKPPFPVAVYTHGSGSTSLEALAGAGHYARHGFATVAIQGVGHGVEVGEIQELLIRGILKESCYGPLGDAVLFGRARDLDKNGVVDSGGDLWTAYFFHTRDVVRQTAIDEIQLIRILRAFDGKRSGNDYDGDGKVNLAGDFDGDGVVDIGGPENTYVAWGSSFGGIVASVVGASDPYISATASNSGGGGMVNIGIRSNEQQVVNAIALGLMGPLIVGRTFDDYGDDPPETLCARDQVSVRWVVPNMRNYAEVEIACVDRTELPSTGGTIVVRNRSNGEVRCGRSDEAGRFRVGLPTSRGDEVVIELYDVPDNIDSYGSCKVVDVGRRVRTIDRWENGFWRYGDVDVNGNDACGHPTGCVRFQAREFAIGSQLVSLVDGFGYIRQTPSFRRLVGLGQTAINAADPINFAPYHGLKTVVDSWGRVRPRRGLAAMVTVGDATVPAYAGMSLGRAAGALPFLRPDAAGKYPGWSDYVTPQDLFDALGERTPNRVYIDNHIVEGVSRLARTPASESCGPNEVPLTQLDCHEECEGDGDCLYEQDCVGGICQRTVSERDCSNSLFDIDVFGEGTEGFGQQTHDPPLRLARIASPARELGVDAVWAPRLSGVPYGGDAGAWDASAPVSMMINTYLVPWGTHTFMLTDRCKAFDTGRYMHNMLGRWFGTHSKDVYYLSHPATHLCLEDDSCPWMTR